jgi:hypothetical protein
LFLLLAHDTAAACDVAAKRVTRASHRNLPLKREPLFNIPPVVIAVLALLALVHAVRTYLLTDDQDQWLLYTFAFIPVRYDTSLVLGGPSSPIR